MKKVIKVVWLTVMLVIASPIMASSNQDVGTVIGGIAGGMIGHGLGGSSGATIGGAVVGSLIGKQMGTSADCDNCRHHYSQWEGRAYPRRYNDFIGPDGRLCRRVVYLSEYGDVIDEVVFRCTRMSQSGYCRRWVKTDY